MSDSNAIRKISTFERLNAFEAGVNAAWKKPQTCPYPNSSEEYKEWHWGYSIGATRLGEKNRRLRSLRLQAARERGTHTEDQWVALIVEFESKCVRCGLTSSHLDKDHIIPIYRGGSDHIDNLQPLCPKCNAAKGPENFHWVSHRRQCGFERSVQEAEARPSNEGLA